MELGTRPVRRGHHCPAVLVSLEEGGDGVQWGWFFNSEGKRRRLEPVAIARVILTGRGRPGA